MSSVALTKSDKPAKATKAALAKHDRKHAHDKYVDPYEGEKRKGCSYPHFTEAQIYLPFRMLITGPSGSGKNVAMWNLLRLLDCFTRYLVVAKELDQKTIKDLRERAEEAKISYEETNDLRAMPPVESWNAKQNNLVIVDDMICEDKKNLKLVEDYYVRCRHRNVSIIFLSQDYFAMPKMMRRNADILVFKSIASRTDIKRIINDNSLLASPDAVQAMYQYSVKCKPGEKAHMKWFTIDKGNPNPDYTYRHNFDPIHAVHWDPQAAARQKTIG